MNKAGINKNSGSAPGPQARWYCVYAKPRMEFYAKFHLERQKIAVFMPVTQIRKKYKGRYSTRTFPLFPRYLFAKFKVEEFGTKIRSTRGVCSLVAFGGPPARVPEGMIEEIRARCVDGDVVEVCRDFQAGDQVSVVEGPYAGLSAVFFRQTTARERVVILLDVMNTCAQVEIDKSALQLEAGV